MGIGHNIVRDHYQGEGMSGTQQEQRQTGADERVNDFDAVIVGAGFAGLYALHKLGDEMRLSARVFEAGDGVGGTWYWNRYPGARSDTSSWIYCYSFDEELLQEWQWSERYPQQHEVLGYLEHVADRFDLNQDIQLGTRVTEATFDEETKRWEVRTDTGDVVSARFLVAALGALSAANVPDVPGLENFAGDRYHTAEWPHEGVDFTGKTVAVIGTGATGIQVATEISEQGDHLTVFQRTPNYAVPPGRTRPAPATPTVLARSSTTRPVRTAGSGPILAPRTFARGTSVAAVEQVRASRARSSNERRGGPG